MADPNITEEVFFEMLEKKADGSFKAKYPKVKSKSGVTFDEHLAETMPQCKVTIRDQNNNIIDQYTKLIHELFFEISSPRKINIEVYNKRFLRTLIDATSLNKGQVAVKYDNKLTEFYYKDVVSIEKCANSKIDVHVEPLGNSINGLIYDNISFNFSAYITDSQAIRMNNDGTKMFILNLTSKDIFQFSLTNPFDLSSISYDNVKFNVSGNEPNPYGFTFNNNGTKMFVVGNLGTIFQYSLSTPFDISTTIYDNLNLNLKSFEATIGAIRSIVFNNDGTKIFTTDASTSNKVRQFSVKIPFDITSVSYYTTYVFSRGASDGMHFNHDGTKLWIVGRGNRAIYEQDLKHPFDLTSAQYNDIYHLVNAQSPTPRDIIFNHNFSKMFLICSTNKTIYQYTVQSNYIGTTYVGIKF